MDIKQRCFLEAYYKAANTSDAEDWLQAALAAKRMFNDLRHNGQSEEETEIQETAAHTYGGNI